MSKIKVEMVPPSASEALLLQFSALIEQAKSPERLNRALTLVVGELLRRDSDVDYRAETLSQIERNFASGHDLGRLTAYAKTVLYKVLVERMALKRLEPEPESNGRQTYGDFETLLSVALQRRVGNAVGFFHRRHPKCVRPMKPPFILAPEFVERLNLVIAQQIVPAMLNSRQMRVIGAMRGWQDVTDVEFWGALGDRYATLAMLWEQAWEAFRPTRRQTKAGARLVASDELKQLREDLASDAYMLPRVDDKMISLFVDLIDPAHFNREKLEEAWVRIRQFYEQEMDTGAHQDQARQGALRDSLLAVCDRFDERTGEFIVLQCYWNFPKLNLRFLHSFMASKAVSRDDRERRIPFLVWYLDQPEVVDDSLKEVR